MNPLTPDIVTTRSLVKFTRMGHTDDTLAPIVDQGNAWVSWAIGRPLDASMPVQFVSIVEGAIVMWVERMAHQRRPSNVEDAADDVVTSFTAGSYSQTSADPTTRGTSKAITNWRPLVEMLLPAMTDDMIDYWNQQLNGTHAPAFFTEEVVWRPNESMGCLPWPHHAGWLPEGTYSRIVG